MSDNGLNGDHLERIARALEKIAAALEHMPETAHPTPSSGQPLDKLYDEFGLNMRAFNQLRHGNIATIEQLQALKVHDILRINNIGRKTLANIHSALAAYAAVEHRRAGD